MAHVLFDTFKFVESLKKAGLNDDQAKAFLTAQQEFFAEAIDNNLSTKSDVKRVEKSIACIEKEIVKVEVELKLIKWLFGIVIAGIGALILKTFF